MESWNPIPSSSHPRPKLPAGVLTAKSSARTGAWEVEPGVARRPAPAPVSTNGDPASAASCPISQSSPPTSSAPPSLPSAFPFARPSLKERKVPSAGSGPAAIGGRSVTGMPNQSVHRNASRAAIGQFGGCPSPPLPLSLSLSTSRPGRLGGGAGGGGPR